MRRKPPAPDPHHYTTLRVGLLIKPRYITNLKYANIDIAQIGNSRTLQLDRYAKGDHYNNTHNRKPNVPNRTFFALRTWLYNLSCTPPTSRTWPRRGYLSPPDIWEFLSIKQTPGGRHMYIVPIIYTRIHRAQAFLFPMSTIYNIN